MKRILPVSLLLLSTVLFLLFYGCHNKTESTDKPTVTTDSINEITNNSVVVYGNVVNDQTIAVVVRGVCYSSTSTTPTIHDKVKNVSGTMWNFSAPVTGLSPATKYYVRAYATLQQPGDDSSTGYGRVISFTTLP